MITDPAAMPQYLVNLVRVRVLGIGDGAIVPDMRQESGVRLHFVSLPL